VKKKLSLLALVSKKQTLRWLLVMSVFFFLLLRSQSVLLFSPSLLPEGSVLWGKDLSGLTQEVANMELRELVSQRLEESVSVSVSREEDVSQEEGTLYDFGVRHNSFQTLQLLSRNAGSYGTADLFFVEAKESFEAEVPALHLDEVVFEEKLASLEEQVRNADIEYSESAGRWLLVPERAGYEFSPSVKVELRSQLLKIARDPGQELELNLEQEKVLPIRKREQLEPLYRDLQSVLSGPVSWVVDGKEEILFFDEYPRLVRPNLKKKELNVNEVMLEGIISGLAERYDRGEGAKAYPHPVLQERGYLKLDRGGYFGRARSLDVVVMKTILSEALTVEEKAKEIALPFVYSDEALQIEEGVDLQYLSTGRSSFEEGNAPARVHNIRFGLSKYEGVVVPPGETFSFNQVLGWVKLEDGWQAAPAIFGGGGVRPVPGGGLCQVSTTMYRAAINAGLPIVARKPHSLDVSYYHKYGDGIDSTVYPPEDIDLAFVNDTPGNLYIHTYTEGEEAVVEFYGVDDGRSIELEQVVNRPIYPPFGITEYTSELDPGVQELARRRRVGRYVEWDWNITRTDGTVDQRKVETVYPAQQQVIRVGVVGEEIVQQ
jgi:vancomycin resistance protein YoaR